MHAAFLAALFAASAPSPSPAPASPWTSAAPGLEIGAFDAPVRSAFGDSRITIARIDPEHYEFRLLSAKLLKLDGTLTAPEWARRHHVTGVINASMYSTDHRSSVAFMKDATGVNNARWTKDNAVFAAAPTDKALPPVQILDRACGKADEVQDGYAILIRTSGCSTARGPTPGRSSRGSGARRRWARTARAACSSSIADRRIRCTTSSTCCARCPWT